MDVQGPGGRVLGAIAAGQLPSRISTVRPEGARLASGIRFPVVRRAARRHDETKLGQYRVKNRRKRQDKPLRVPSLRNENFSAVRTPALHDLAGNAATAVRHPQTA